jgi:rhodanese-related sulfurtransferase
MYFKQFLHDETGCASYFLASRQTREAIVAGGTSGWRNAGLPTES